MTPQTTPAGMPLFQPLLYGPDARPHVWTCINSDDIRWLLNNLTTLEHGHFGVVQLYRRCYVHVMPFLSNGGHRWEDANLVSWLVHECHSRGIYVTCYVNEGDWEGLPWTLATEQPQRLGVDGIYLDGIPTSYPENQPEVPGADEYYCRRTTPLAGLLASYDFMRVLRQKAVGPIILHRSVEPAVGWVDFQGQHKPDYALWGETNGPGPTSIDDMQYWRYGLSPMYRNPEIIGLFRPPNQKAEGIPDWENDASAIRQWMDLLPYIQCAYRVNQRWANGNVLSLFWQRGLKHWKHQQATVLRNHHA